jgi:hypothetical protein
MTTPFPIVIDQWAKNSRERVRVAIDNYYGHNLSDLRTYWPDGYEWKPGKGLACRITHLPRLVDALSKALTTAEEHGLLDKDGGAL